MRWSSQIQLTIIVWQCCSIRQLPELSIKIVLVLVFVPRNGYWTDSYTMTICSLSSVLINRCLCTVSFCSDYTPCDTFQMAMHNCIKLPKWDNKFDTSQSCPHFRIYAVQIAQKIKVLTCVYYNLTHVYYKIGIPCVYYFNHPCVDNFSKCYKIMYHACLILRLCACISKFVCACFRIILTFESTWPFCAQKTDWGITH